jgi:hypothetical protein
LNRRDLPPLAILLTFLLVVWEPLSFALTASSALSRLVGYGVPAVLLLGYRGFVVGLGIAAGRALWTVQPLGPRLGQWWAVLHAVGDVLTLSTPFFPSNRVPGTKGWSLALLIVLDVLCWTWLRYSPRVRGVYLER